MAGVHKLFFAWPPCVVCWTFFSLLAITSISFAGVVVQAVPPDYGEIDLHPAGGAVTIAAQNGPSVPSSLFSVVTGGGSGSLILSSDDPEQVEVLYPDNVTLTSGNDSIILRKIANFSQTTADMPGGNVQQTLSIGGVLELRGDEKRGSYSGSMTILINYF